MQGLSTVTLAHAVAQILWLSPMARSEVVDFLRSGAGVTEEHANEVIAYGLAHSLLVEDPTGTTRLRGTPKLSKRP
jgi:hypothetical protein